MNYTPSPPIRVVSLEEMGKFLNRRRERLLISAGQVAKRTGHYLVTDAVYRIESAKYKTWFRDARMLTELGDALGIVIVLDEPIGKNHVFCVTEKPSVDYLKFLMREYTRAELEAFEAMLINKPQTEQDDALQNTSHARETFTDALLRSFYGPNPIPRYLR